MRHWILSVLSFRVCSCWNCCAASGHSDSSCVYPDDAPIVVTSPWARNTDIHLPRYFNSKFHIFDATVILAGFVVDVLLHGTIQEAGSLVVIGRLWRVFKIIEEFSSGAQEQIEGLQERIEQLEKENEACRRENEDLKQRVNKKADVPD
jgi:hypothetical protein